MQNLDIKKNELEMDCYDDLEDYVSNMRVNIQEALETPIDMEHGYVKMHTGTRGTRISAGIFSFKIYPEFWDDFKKEYNNIKTDSLVTDIKLYLKDIQNKTNKHYEVDGYGSYSDFINWALKKHHKQTLNDVYLLNQAMEKSGSLPCLAMVQLINYNLFKTKFKAKSMLAISRSCDYSLGFLEDLKMLCYIAFEIQKVDILYWQINDLHIYENNWEIECNTTILQGTKGRKFNARKIKQLPNS